MYTLTEFNLEYRHYIASVLTKFRLNFTTKRKEVEIKCCFPLTSPVCNSFGAFSAEPMRSCSIQASSSTARRRKEGGSLNLL
uniref:Uncharacterized protein n=1 Tax=Aegilops tauschii subsp. strangulata TaxID=200361 RepID=A0A453ILV0_AEGTS